MIYITLIYVLNARSLRFKMINYRICNYIFSIDPYTRKDWYDVKAPAMFTNRNIGKTLVTRTQGKSKC